MATLDDDIKIDLDALDEVKEQKVKKNGAKDPATPVVEPADDQAPAKVSLKPEDGLAKLQKQLDDEKIARADADRRASEASAAEVAARTDSQTNRLHLVTTALDSKKQASALLKAKYIEARTANDMDAEFEIQQDMSKIAAEIIQLEAGKKALEQQPKPTARPTTDPVAQFTANMSPQSAAWIRSHPEYVHDNKLNRKMIRAHEDALDEGIREDTPAYFESIERQLGITKDIKLDPPADDNAMSDAAAPARRAAPASAPVTRSGNGAGARANVVTLTRDEVEIAEMTGQTAEEFARNKMALKKEGRLN